MRRKGKRSRGIPKRPLRWISAGNYLNTNELDGCAVDFVNVPCGPPDAEFLFPGAQEIVRADVDLDFADKSSPTISRIVGDLTVRAGWQVAIDPPGFSAPFFISTPPVVRLGLIVVDEVNLAGWFPPDIFDADDAEEPWMWRAQLDFNSGNDVREGAVQRFPGGNQAFNRSYDAKQLHVDVRVNRKISMGESLILVYQWRRNNPVFLNLDAETLDEIASVGVSLLQDLRVLVKC